MGNAAAGATGGGTAVRVAVGSAVPGTCAGGLATLVGAATAKSAAGAARVAARPRAGEGTRPARGSIEGDVAVRAIGLVEVGGRERSGGGAIRAEVADQQCPERADRAEPVVWAAGNRVRYDRGAGGGILGG